MSVLRRLAGRALSAAYLVPAVALYLAKVRFLATTHHERIGHLAVEPDCFLKEIELGDVKPGFTILLIDPRQAANLALLEYWARHIHVVTSTLLRRLLTPFLRFQFLRMSTYRYTVAIDETAALPSINARWGDRPPILRLDRRDIERGQQCLHEMGVPEGAWFVCVHSREGGYSPTDEHLHEYRNSDIDSYILAMKAIVARGGWCIRVGDASMKEAPRLSGVVDYARSPFKCDWMDVFLCASCRFFFGNTSGLFLVSTAFGVPCALANMTPLSASFPPGAHDLGIPKLLVDESGELIPLSQAFQLPATNFRFAESYRASRVWVRDNTPEEIRDLALEMLDRLDGKIVYTPEDEALQERFRRLLRPGHYSYGAASRIGRSFLRDHADLLEPQSVRDAVG